MVTTSDAAPPLGGALRGEAFRGYLGACRDRALSELGGIIPDDGRYGRVLYDLMTDYPLREAKGLRPALCIAACRALGGTTDAVARTAAVLELYHNAFLIHDDIEDESLLRRGAPTLHRAHGVPIAVNVGDAMLGLALEPLLDNIEVIGLGPALRVLRAVARMSRETAEGQALELDWIRHARWDVTDDDYVEMVVKKTGWYSFMTPLRVGGISAGAAPEVTDTLVEFGRLLSIAFQVQDDVLNLAGDEDEVGKERAGDLWEGKRTLILLHALRTAPEAERGRATEILSMPRARQAGAGAAGPTRGEEEVRSLLDLVERRGSLDYARAVAHGYAERAAGVLAAPGLLADSVHRDFLLGLVAYVHRRSR